MPLRFQPISAFDPIVELDDKAREIRRTQFVTGSAIGSSAKGCEFPAENRLKVIPKACRGERGERLADENISLAHGSQLREAGLEGSEKLLGVLETKRGGEHANG